MGKEEDKKKRGGGVHDFALNGYVDKYRQTHEVKDMVLVNCPPGFCVALCCFDFVGGGKRAKKKKEEKRKRNKELLPSLPA